MIRPTHRINITDTAYDALHKIYRSHRAVFEALAAYNGKRTHGFRPLCRANGIDPDA